MIAKLVARAYDVEVHAHIMSLHMIKEHTLRAVPLKIAVFLFNRLKFVSAKRSAILKNTWVAASANSQASRSS